MKNNTFGVEIEMGKAKAEVVQAALVSVMAGAVACTVPYKGGYVPAVAMADGRTWLVVQDGSILARDGHELVSPILKWKDLEMVQAIVRALKSAGCTSRAVDQCGIHVHVGAAAHSPKSIVNLVNIIATRQSLLYKALAVDNERVRYCKELGEVFIALVEAKKPKTFAELRELWYRAFPSTNRSHTQNSHYHSSRYQGLNLHSLFSGKTVEFRLFNGTLHAGLIRTYILLCLALSAQAINLKSSRSNRRSVEIENEKYSMRCWLLRLGFIGDYFKNPRFHLLEKLSGDSAWRYPESRVNGRSPVAAAARSYD